MSRTLAVLAILLIVACSGKSESGGSGAAQSGGSGSGGGSGTGGVGAGGSGTAGNGIAGSGVAGAGPSCTSQSCAGCCDHNDTCQSGQSVTACGLSGARCLNCATLDLECRAGSCEAPPAQCGPGNCSGCCDAAGRCRAGVEVDACGNAGGACTNCGGQQLGCVNGACEGAPPPCGPGVCGGCCTAQGQCVAGANHGACGIGGESCTNCQTDGRRCIVPGNYCGFLPTCGPNTCPDGCCDAAGLCQRGRSNAACGSNGEACRDCASNSETCAPQGFCYAGVHCGPDTCGGCCSANGDCLPGADSASCGSFGGLCENCTTLGETCQGGTCSDGSTCPAAYAGCNPDALTPLPRTSTACSASDLDTIKSACAGSNPGSTCWNTISGMITSNPGCYDCVSQFLTEGVGYVRCLAPFLSEDCNHDLTCAVTCGDVACGNCATAAEEEACRDTSFSAGSDCQPYVNGYFCLLAAQSGPAAFCDFNQYSGDVGAYVGAVAGYYCGG